VRGHAAGVAQVDARDARGDERLRRVQEPARRIDGQTVGRRHARPAALHGAVGADAVQLCADVVGGVHGAVGRARDAVGHSQAAHPRLRRARVRIDAQEPRKADPIADQPAMRAVAVADDQPPVAIPRQPARTDDPSNEHLGRGVGRVHSKDRALVPAAGLAAEEQPPANVDDHRLQRTLTRSQEVHGRRDGGERKRPSGGRTEQPRQRLTRAEPQAGHDAADRARDRERARHASTVEIDVAELVIAREGPPTCHPCGSRGGASRFRDRDPSRGGRQRTAMPIKAARRRPSRFLARQSERCSSRIAVVAR
jgi:hypothetical protein